MTLQKFQFQKHLRKAPKLRRWVDNRPRLKPPCVRFAILAFGGSRLKRAELLWVAYVAIAFGTLKLLFEDLRFGNAASLVASPGQGSPEETS